VAAWRWHFYAGLFVVPFVLMLALSGLVMVLHEPIETALYRDLFVVEPGAVSLSPEAQVAAVAERYPEAGIASFIPSWERDRANQVAVIVPSDGRHVHGSAEAEPTRTVFVDPYTGTVLGSLDPARMPEGWATLIHGTLLAGTFGDVLIEIAAGFAILLVVTGLFMWYPRRGRGLAFRLVPPLRLRKRTDWRDLHASAGLWTSGVLLFFMVSGLSWTLIWGERLTQAWSTLPAERSTALSSDLRYSDLNRAPLHEVPWALEQARVPASGGGEGGLGLAAGTPVTLNHVMAFAEEQGFTTYRVMFPRGETGSWTVQAATMSGDVTDPRQDRTLHIDQYSGRVLADIGFADYSFMGKGMAAGIALHQGDVGTWNMVLNTLFCFTLLVIAVSGVAMWWMRRPVGQARLAPPPLPGDLAAWKRATVFMFALSLAFPLVAATLGALWLLDFLVVSRVPRLAAALK
jgi:uncharacterized iron-regulated membrane protein